MERKVSESGIVYYENRIESENMIFLVGGLGDMANGFYTSEIFQFGAHNRCKTISIQLRSMPEYGLYTIDSDVEDVAQLYTDLSINNYKSVVFIGHSTGCQILLLYSICKKKRSTEVIVLQAPVSDREYEERANPSLSETLALAEDLSQTMDKRNSIDQNKEENTVLYLKYRGMPMRADRFISLFKKGGKEDFFSIGQKTSHLNKSETRIYAVLSKYDEYQTAPIEKSLEQIKSIPHMEETFLINSTHGLVGTDQFSLSGLEEFCSILKRILDSLHNMR